MANNESGDHPFRFVGAAMTGGKRSNGGRRAVIAPGKTVTLLETEGSPNEPRQCTVTLGPHEGPTTRTEDDERVFIPPPTLVAIVQWGADGANNQIEVDWKQGTVISVGCSYLRVSCRNDSTTEDEAFSANVCAFGSLDVRPSNHPNTLTLPGVSAGEEYQVVIPPMAVEVTVLPTEFDATFESMFEDRDNADICIAGTCLQSRAPIPNHARYVTSGDPFVGIFHLPL